MISCPFPVTAVVFKNQKGFTSINYLIARLSLSMLHSVAIKRWGKWGTLAGRLNRSFHTTILANKSVIFGEISFFRTEFHVNFASTSLIPFHATDCIPYHFIHFGHSQRHFHFVEPILPFFQSFSYVLVHMIIISEGDNTIVSHGWKKANPHLLRLWAKHNAFDYEYFISNFISVTLILITEWTESNSSDCIHCVYA